VNASGLDDIQCAVGDSMKLKSLTTDLPGSLAAEGPDHFTVDNTEYLSVRR